MKIITIKNNPPLTLGSVKSLGLPDLPRRMNLMVAPSLKGIAVNIMDALLHEFAGRNSVPFLQAADVAGCSVVIDMDIPNNEWRVRTPKAMYISKGDSSA